MELNKLKNGIKKIAAVAGTGIFAMATISGALAAADLSKIATAGGSFIDSNGNLNANIVLGTGGATNVVGFAQDVAGAIEVGAALAQKATSSTGNSAVLSTTAWEGANTTITIGATSATPMTLDWQNITAFAKYQWDEDGTTKNATQVFGFSNTINSTGLELTFPIGSLNLTLDVEGDDINDTGDFLKIGNNVYKVLDVWDTGNTADTPTNVTVGISAEDEKFSVGDEKTYSGITVKLLGIDSSSGNAQLEFSGDSSEGTKTVVKQQGQSYTYGNIEVSVDTTWGGTSPYAILDVVYDKQVLKSGHVFFGDENYNVTTADGDTASNSTEYIALTNNKIIKLTEGESVEGPMGLFNITFIKTENVASSETGSEYQNITVSDAPAIVNTFDCSPSGNYFNVSTENNLIIPGLKYYKYDVNTDTIQDKLAETSNSTEYNTAGNQDIIAYTGENTSVGTREFRLHCDSGTLTAYYASGSSWTQLNSGGNATTPGGLFLRNDGGTVSVRAPAVRLTISNGGPWTGGNATIYGRKGSDKLVLNTTGAEKDVITLDGEYVYAVYPTYTNLTWDGDAASNKGILTITEANGDSKTITVEFNDTTFFSNITAWDYTNLGTTTFGSKAFWTNSTRDGKAANITDAENVTIRIPQKKLVYGTGSWGSNDITLSQGETHNFTKATDVTLSSVAGGVNYVTPNFAKLDTETGVKDLPVILIGGPSVNALVKELADANKTWASSDYAENRAIIDLIADAFATGKNALVIAGYAGKDTRLAARVVASEILYPDTLSVDFTNKTRVILNTGVTEYTDVTEVTE